MSLTFVLISARFSGVGFGYLVEKSLTAISSWWFMTFKCFLPALMVFGSAPGSSKSIDLTNETPCLKVFGRSYREIETAIRSISFCASCGLPDLANVNAFKIATCWRRQKLKAAYNFIAIESLIPLSKSIKSIRSSPFSTLSWFFMTMTYAWFKYCGRVAAPGTNWMSNVWYMSTRISFFRVRLRHVLE